MKSFYLAVIALLFSFAGYGQDVYISAGDPVYRRDTTYITYNSICYSCPADVVYEWYFSDGTVQYGPSVTQAYFADSAYTGINDVTVIASDGTYYSTGFLSSAYNPYPYVFNCAFFNAHPPSIDTVDVGGDISYRSFSTCDDPGSTDVPINVFDKSDHVYFPSPWLLNVSLSWGTGDTTTVIGDASSAYASSPVSFNYSISGGGTPIWYGTAPYYYGGVYNVSAAVTHVNPADGSTCPVINTPLYPLVVYGHIANDIVTGTTALCPGDTLQLNAHDTTFFHSVTHGYAYPDFMFAPVRYSWLYSDSTGDHFLTFGDSVYTSPAFTAANAGVYIFDIVNVCGTEEIRDSVTVSVGSASIISGPAHVCAGASVLLSDSVAGGTWTSSDATIATVDASGNVTGVRTGMATISYTTTGSCGGTATMDITVDNVYAGIITGITAIAPGGTTTLADTAAGGTWASSDATVATVSGGIVTGVAAGTAVITYTVTNSCGTANAILGVVVAPAGAGTGPNIYTIAGTGTAGYSGDGGTATSAMLYLPARIATDRSGNVYIADIQNHRIRKVNMATGIITTVAGNGTGGYSGDGGAATAAELYYPGDVAIDSSGNLYIADGGNGSVRKVSAATGIITTVAGDGIEDYSDFGIGTDGVAATATEFGQIGGIAIDAGGNLYISDFDYNRIHKVDAATGIITTIAGNGYRDYYGGSYYGGGGYSGDGGAATSAEIANPGGIAVDNSGNVYIADQTNNCIRKVTAATGIISTVAGGSGSGYSGDGGAATSATLNIPADVKIDDSGNLYIVDEFNDCIRKVSGASGIISTVAGIGIVGYSGDGGPATSAQLNYPTGVALNGSRDIFISDNSNNRIRIVGTLPVWPVATANHAPHFYNADYIDTICAGSSLSLNTQLSVIDSDAGQTETWSIIGAPLHGIATIAYTVSSTGDTLVPTGLNYVSDTGSGFGIDWITVMVSDGTDSDTATILISTVGLPRTHPVTGPDSVCAGSIILLSDSVTGGAWISSNISAATVDAGGIVTGVGAGTTTISYTVSYTCGTTVATKRITINPVTPTPAAITGLAAVCAGSSITLSEATIGGLWSSSDAAVATVDASGMVTGVAAGTATISYTISRVCGMEYVIHIVTVNPATSAPAAIAGLAVVCEGAIITLTDGTTGGAWSSSDAAVATVDAAGTVTGVAAGTTSISYTVGGTCGTAMATALITVNPLPHAGSIAGATAVCAGSSITLYDTTTGGVWSSSDAATATTDASGLITGVVSGMAAISYTVTNICGDASATASVSVYGVSSAGAISGAGAVCAGSIVTLTDAAGSGAWSSSDAAVATVDAAGTVTGIAPGTATISYTVTGSCGAAYATAGITVNALPAVAITALHTAVCAGGSDTLTASGSAATYTWDGTGITIVSPTAVAISAAGAYTVTASSAAGCTSSSSVTITAGTAPVVTAAATAACGGTMVTASGAVTYMWMAATDLACTTCASTLATPSVTTIYSVVGTDAFGCIGAGTVTVSGNRISGHVTFSGAAPDTLDMRIWLIQYNPADSSLTALDSTTTCLDGGVSYYQFDGEAAGNYMVKAKLLYGNTPGMSGYVPTYSLSSPYWDSAATAAHTTDANTLDIVMTYGTVPSGPGFIGGSVVMGAGRGTSGEVPAPGIIVYLRNAASGILTYTYTDAAGLYGFHHLANGTYNVYPTAFDYTTTPSATVTLTSATDSVANINFKQHTTLGTITPFTSATAVNNVTAGSGITVFPNPASNNLTIKWGRQAAGNATVTLTDAAGREAYHVSLGMNSSGGQATLSLRGLQPGTYVISIKSATADYSSKLVIE